MKSASFARPFAEMVSVASTLMSFAQPQSFKTSSREFFKNNEVPRPLPHTVSTLPFDSTVAVFGASLSDAPLVDAAGAPWGFAPACFDASPGPSRSSRSSSAVPTVSSLARVSFLPKSFASSFMDWVCALSSCAARATTRLTGSLVPWPKATGVSKRTQEMAVRFTASDGRACAKAKPGATTMYGPLTSRDSIMACV